MPLVNIDSFISDKPSTETQKTEVYKTPQLWKKKNTLLAQTSVEVIRCLAFSHRMGIHSHSEAADKQQVNDDYPAAIHYCIDAANRRIDT